MNCFALILATLLVLQTANAAVDQRLSPKRWAYYGEEFYQQLSARTVTKSQIAKILNSTHSTRQGQFDQIGACTGKCYQHTSLSYPQVRRVLFGTVYVQRDQQGTFIREVYCGKKFHFRSVEDAASRHTEVNVEHTWPQSRFSRSYNKNVQKTDMHHLFLTDSEANNRRASHEFGSAGNAANELNMRDCGESKLVRQGAEYNFEPPKDHRGNVARAIFYFSSHYNLPIDADEERDLREWHRQDPVDELERERHEIVAGIQLVRNPFIDHPELVELIADF